MKEPDLRSPTWSIATVSPSLSGKSPDQATKQPVITPPRNQLGTIPEHRLDSVPGEDPSGSPIHEHQNFDSLSCLITSQVASRFNPLKKQYRLDKPHEMQMQVRVGRREKDIH